MVKKTGNRLRVYFSKAGAATMNGRIKRMPKNEIQQMLIQRAGV